MPLPCVTLAAAVLVSSASLLKEGRDDESRKRQSWKKMKITVQGVGDRDAKKPQAQKNN